MKVHPPGCPQNAPKHDFFEIFSERQPSKKRENSGVPKNQKMGFLGAPPQKPNPWGVPKTQNPTLSQVGHLAERLGGAGPPCPALGPEESRLSSLRHRPIGIGVFYSTPASRGGMGHTPSVVVFLQSKRHWTHSLQGCRGWLMRLSCCGCHSPLLRLSS